MKLCSDLYRFKKREVLMGDDVIKRYCREALDENCVRLVQFMIEQIDYRNCYEADCQLIREETCDIIELLATE